jgi:uncharacterized protein YdcH (DUF465 family)
MHPPFHFAPHSEQEAPMSQDLRDDLLTDNEEYRRLEKQHHEYEDRLNSLSEKVVLDQEEQVEEVTLKKKKLQVKDRMHEIARQVRGSAAHP